MLFDERTVLLNRRIPRVADGDLPNATLGSVIFAAAEEASGAEETRKVRGHAAAFKTEGRETQNVLPLRTKEEISHAARFRIARKVHEHDKALMFFLGGDAFPHDTQTLRAALSHGAEARGAGEGSVTIDGDFPSLEAIRMNLTGVHLDGQAPPAPAPENPAGGCFARVLEVTAEPALLAGIPLRVRFRADACVFAFGVTAGETRAAWLQKCASGTLDAAAATSDMEAALLGLARDAASKHGAEVESVRLTLEAENPRQLAVTAVAVAKAMFFTATLTIRGRIALDGDFNLRLTESTCTGDGMIANLAAAQLRPRLAELEGRVLSIRSFLPSGLQPSDVALTGGAALQIRATIGAGTPHAEADDAGGK